MTDPIWPTENPKTYLNRVKLGTQRFLRSLISIVGRNWVEITLYQLDEIIPQYPIVSVKDIGFLENCKREILSFVIIVLFVGEVLRLC